MDDGLQYRQIIGGMMSARADLRGRKPQPEVVVKLELDDDEEKIVKELLGTPGLEFKITAIDSSDGVSIELHIRVKQPKAAVSMPRH